MLIDWFTVGAQAVNFIVLVWLLQRFLYKPVLSAIDAREKRIAGELADADRQRAEAKQSRDDLRAKYEAFDGERAALLAKAALDAKTLGEGLMSQARAAADALVSQRRAAVDGETAELSRGLATLAAAESIGIARAALRDLAGADLEVRIGEVFVKRVRQLDSKARESFIASLKASNGDCVVVSSFVVAERERAEIQSALHDALFADIHLRFETSTAVIGGIELNASGLRLSWTIADYLKTLDEKVAALLRASGAPTGTPAPAAPDHGLASPRTTQVPAAPGRVAPAAAA